MIPIARYRQGPVDRIVGLLRDQHSKGSFKISIIAHSFGTYCFVKLLEQNPELRFHKVILCGSVVPDLFDWARYAHQIDYENSSGFQVINDCGMKDVLPVFAKSITWGYGSAGRFGFGHPRVKDRYFNIGHSGFFDEKFVRTYWLPYLSKGQIKEGVLAIPTTPWWVSSLTNFKLRYVVIVLALAALMFALDGYSRVQSLLEPDAFVPADPQPASVPATTVPATAPPARSASSEPVATTAPAMAASATSTSSPQAATTVPEKIAPATPASAALVAMQSRRDSLEIAEVPAFWLGISLDDFKQSKAGAGAFWTDLPGGRGYKTTFGGSSNGLDGTYTIEFSDSKLSAMTFFVDAHVAFAGDDVRYKALCNPNKWTMYRQAIEQYFGSPVDIKSETLDERHPAYLEHFNATIVKRESENALVQRCASKPDCRLVPIEGVETYSGSAFLYRSGGGATLVARRAAFGYQARDSTLAGRIVRCEFNLHLSTTK